MFGLRLRTELTARVKNGHPPQRTTGVARRSSTQVRIRAERRPRRPGTISDIARNERRRQHDADPEPAGHVDELRVRLFRRRLIARGSSAMPQIGHDPGAFRTISGCIGQVHSLSEEGPAGGGAGFAETEAGATNRVGSVLKRSTQ